jgi:His/Glu/Gln/Arg/opine family amino acid ABC transporter permease subunit
MFNIENIPLLLTGMRVTLIVWGGSALCSLVLGTVFGLLCCAPLRIPIIAPLMSAITMVLRGIPFYIQLLIAYFVIPDLLGLANVNASLMATLALGLCSAAYTSQAVVSGINGIATAQWETAFVLGYSPLQTIRFIILPQLIAAITPALCAEADQLIKSTAIFSSIGIMELTGMARNIITREFNPIPIYLTIAGMYLVISLTLNGIIRLAQKTRRTYAKS